MVVIIARRMLVLKDIEGGSDHSVGNSSLSAREIGSSKIRFFNLWTLMFELGVADLSVPPLVEGNLPA